MRIGWIYALCSFAVALPIVVVDYPPLDDTPEHMLQPKLVDALTAKDPLFVASFELNERPRTVLFSTALFSTALAILSPPRAVAWASFLLALALLAAVWFVASARGPPSAAILFAPLFALDVSFFKGFTNFYGSLVFMFAAAGCVLRLGPQTKRPYLYGAGLAVLAVATVIAHPYPYALLAGFGLGAIVALRDRATALRIVVAALPSVIAALVVLFSLMGPAPENEALHFDYVFGPKYKVLHFFHEGWRTLGRWQPWPQLVATVVLLGVWGRTRGSRWPIVAAVCLVLYLVLPEGMTAWSWISIRMPLLFALALTIETARRAIPPAATRALAVGAGVLTLGVAGLTYRTADRLSSAIDEYVQSAKAVPRGSPLLPILPPVYPSAGRVNVLHHATAYIAAERGTPYPEIFAKDPRHHWVSVAEPARARVFDLDRALPWWDYVDPQVRAAWFETHGGTVIAFEAAPGVLERLDAAASSSHVVSDRVRVYRRGLKTTNRH